MKSKLWITPIILLVLLVSLLITACGGAKTETATTSTTATATVTATSTSTTTSTTTATSKATSTATSKATSTTATTASGPQYGGTLRIIWFKPPSRGFGWEPISKGGYEGYSVWPCLETLVHESRGSEITPWLATEWKVAPDGLSATLKLRQGVKFHDGTPFNADAVKYNYDAVIAAKTISPNLLSVDVVDDYTIRMNFGKYYNTWLSEYCRTFIVSPTAVKTKGAEWASWNPVGTGAFKFVSMEPDVKVLLTRNDDWWGPKPYLDNIENIFIVDTMTQVMAMKGGEGDLICSRLGKTMHSLEDAGFQIITQRDGLGYVGPSSAKPDSVWANKLVREALYYAVDSQKIVDAYGYGYWLASNQAAPPEYNGYIPELEKMRGYNPDKARALVAEAGYSGGFDTKYYVPVNEDKDEATSVVDYLKAVGINAKLEIIEMGKLQEYRYNVGWDGLLQSGMSISSNFQLFLNREFGPGSVNSQGILRPPGWHDLIVEAISSREPEPAKVQAAARVLFDQSLLLPLEIHGTNFAQTPKVHDFNVGQGSFWWEYSPELVWMSK
jgi:peptide/nickel transport system substrate-binding protein